MSVALAAAAPARERCDTAWRYRQFLEESGLFSPAEIDVHCAASQFRAHDFYINLVEFFTPVFGGIAPSTMQELSHISYTLLRSLLAFDKMIDDGADAEFKFALLNHEEATRRLCALFGEHPRFWGKYAQMKARFFASLLAEQKLSGTRMTEERFEQLSWGKSSLVELVVLMLCEIAGDETHASALAASLRALHIGMQYMDDIHDFQADISRGQHTFLFSDVARMLTESGRVPEDTPVETLHRYMVVGGFAEKHYKLALNQFQLATSHIGALDLPAYKNFLQNERETAERALACTLEIVERCRARALTQARVSADVAPAAVRERLERCFGAALEAILARQSEHGLWSDFRTDNGEGVNWISAYTALMLLESEVGDARLDATVKQLRAWPSVRFAYNDGTVQDADSSSFFIALAACSGQTPRSGAVSAWLDFMGSDGGFATYLPATIIPTSDGIIQGTAGWTRPHACVSAVATLIMARYVPEQGPRQEAAARYLLGCQQAWGGWKSYWWTSDVYATSFAIQALAHFPQLDGAREAVERGCAWLMETQANDGAWGERDARPLYTALAAKALLSAAALGDGASQRALDAGIRWLVAAQNDDGGWLSGKTLRVPHPETIDAHTVTSWRYGSNGYNVVVPETTGIFTASTILNCLHSYRQKIWEPRC